MKEKNRKNEKHDKMKNQMKPTTFSEQLRSSVFW